MPETVTDPSAANHRHLLWVILALTFLVYSPSLWNGFTYDDGLYVSTNRTGPVGPNVMVQEIRPLGEYLDHVMGYDGVTENGRGFRPVTVLSYAVVHFISKTRDKNQREGYKDHAWLQHLVNVLLHVMATWLVFMILRTIVTGWPLAVDAKHQGDARTIDIGIEYTHARALA